MRTLSVLLTWQVLPSEWDYVGKEWPGGLEVLRQYDLSADELAAALPSVEAIVGFGSELPRHLFAHAPALRLVQTLGHGVDAVFKAKQILRERGITVARSNPGNIPIAEFVIMSMIAMSRRVIAMHNRLAHFGNWSETVKQHRAEGSLGGELYESTLGLVGYGGIAQEVHRRAAALGMTVGLLTRDPARHRGGQFDFVDLWSDVETFLGRCDYIVLAVPLNDDTRHLMNAARFAAMKPGAYLVNISRGGLVDEDALYDALDSGRLAGAALDVFETEVNGRKGYPTRRPIHQFNVILTPHYATGTVESRFRALRAVGENLRRMLAGEPFINVVDFDRGY